MSLRDSSVQRQRRPSIQTRVDSMVAESHSTRAFDPADCVLDDPPDSVEVNAMRAVAFSDVRLDPERTQDAARRSAAV